MSELKPVESETVVTESVVEAVAPAPVAASPLPLATQPTSQEWAVVTIKSRVDSFNQEALIQEIKDLRAAGHKRIALDMKANRFFSFPVIRACVDAARELSEAEGGFALVACPQKTKRHFEIYGSLKHIRIVRSVEELTPKWTT
jgi:anti-anti-sigma regulatory factor